MIKTNGCFYENNSIPIKIFPINISTISIHKGNLLGSKNTTQQKFWTGVTFQSKDHPLPIRLMLSPVRSLLLEVISTHQALPRHKDQLSQGLELKMQ